MFKANGSVTITDRKKKSGDGGDAGDIFGASSKDALKTENMC
jgi:hypothetical protein